MTLRPLACAAGAACAGCGWGARGGVAAVGFDEEDGFALGDAFDDLGEVDVGDADFHFTALGDDAVADIDDLLVSLGLEDGGDGQIGRASCRERVYSSV